MKKKSALWHTVYSIVSTIFEGIAIYALLTWLLPAFGVRLPLWVTISVLAGFTVFSYVMYRIGHNTMTCTCKEMNSLESMVGRDAVVENWLHCEGYVKIQGELWRATSIEPNLQNKEKIVITGIDGLKLQVARKKNGTEKPST